VEDLNLPWPETEGEEPGIFFTAHDVDFELDHTSIITSWIMNACVQEGYTLQRLDFVFCSDEFLLQINKEHLQHDYYTDIITFPLQRDPIIAEIYISIDRVKENALSMQTSFSDELHRVMIHGVLHLCGYDDHREEDIKIMRAKEGHYLKLLPSF
jgi:rRNA maturation RNase YbeY